MTLNSTDHNNKDEQKKMPEDQSTKTMIKEDLTNLLMAALRQQQSKEQAAELPTQKRKFSFKITLDKLVAFILNVVKSSIYYLDRIANFITKSEDADRNELIQYVRRPVLVGLWTIIIFIGLGGGWAAFAPLDSATVAVGTVISSGNKKVVQNMDTGTIKEVYVKQGDYVVENQPLLELDNTNAKARYEIALNDYRDALANENRLIAEQSQSEQIDFDDFLLQSQFDSAVSKLINSQNKLFKSRIETSQNLVTNQHKKILQHQQQIEGLEAKKKSFVAQRNLVQERLDNIKILVKQGFAQKSQQSDLTSRLEQIIGEIATMDADIAKTRGEISKTEIDISTHKANLLSEILKELRETRNAVSKSREQYNSAKDALEHTIIRAPAEGIVNELPYQYRTKGAVIGQGSMLAEISPINDSLVIEAKISPRDIVSVTTGLKAKIKFSAFKSRISPTFKGTVVFVSPDILIDRGGQRESYYATRIEIDMDEFEALAKKYNFKLHPGLQAEVQIIKGSRTLLRYLLDPLLDQMFRAFIEK